MKKIIAVTGCPTGIAHTFMAEEALKNAAKKLSVEIKVETNGASGVENAIQPADLVDIAGVIIAADKDVLPDRFNGLPVIEVPVKEAIHHPAELINKVINGEAPIRKGESTTSTEIIEKESLGRQIYKHLMSGVSNMLPFVVAVGILIAVSFLWGIYSADPNSAEYNATAAMLMKIGQQAFSIMVPVFTAYIAFSISGRPGMVAGFVGGLLANATGAGFLGGIIAGFAAGYLMLWVKNRLEGLPRQYEGLKSIFIMPLIGVLVIGVLMSLLGQPVAAINNSMMNWLASLQEANPILLGIVVGAMCSFDFGGPVNKAAYVTGTLLLGQGNFYFMAGVSAACITPPLVIALATTFFPKGFSEEERAAGMVNYILGCTHITEGAIPFAAKDPLRVIPMMMIASSISAVLSYSLRIQVPAPHGGFLILPLVSQPLAWVLCILAGSACGAVMLGLWRLWAVRKNSVNTTPVAKAGGQNAAL
ncbi:PTS fructose transporter subunit IIC [Salmonella enterica]|uniref:PTS fructose transporter subunit IIC n=2 Tax=Salmonella enterica TaxID=28901 RepID=A0A754CQ80_SALER|nr:PTS fructose transporter subunit IIBC [Salmonella enterica]EBG6707866.1 PTS fructose transporter subunit IIC [Salmonella enterica subsp. enterica serovar Cerro]EDB6183404.1 PTS fructose transporter subunit IIC [Salmonella enterica subsp. enterica serovar Typhimurium]EDH8175627.1 PTS fructose transporter subunit IIC [Salmonella enterica subsp. enterica serovar Typhimurium]EGS6966469.1 PTS transporter subunit EIIC [Salmonella enterica]EHL9688686.1 PTS transporter subunit EIIC [Salmonella ente